MNLSIGAIWNFNKGTELLYPSIRVWGTEGLFKGLGASEPQGLEPKYPYNSVLYAQESYMIHTLVAPRKVAVVYEIYHIQGLWFTFSQDI